MESNGRIITSKRPMIRKETYKWKIETWDPIGHYILKYQYVNSPEILMLEITFCFQENGLLWRKKSNYRFSSNNRVTPSRYQSGPWFRSRIHHLFGINIFWKRNLWYQEIFFFRYSKGMDLQYYLLFLIYYWLIIS